MAPWTPVCGLSLPCLVLLLLLETPGAGAQEFQLLQPEGAVSVSAGETLTLTCSVTGVAPVGPVKWFKGSGSGRQLVYTDTGSLPRVTRAVPGSDTDYTIRISDTRPADAGIYHCVKFRKTGTGPDVEFRSGAGTTVSVSGAWTQEFQLLQPEGAVWVSPGETLTLTCSVTGVAPVGPTKWFKGSGSGRQLVYADKGSFPRVTRAELISDTNFTIRISDTRPADAGIYHCVKFRKTGTGPDVEFRSGAGTTVSVSEAGAQEFQLLQPEGAVWVSAGETLTLNCFQTGVAPVGPTKWFKGSGSGRQLVYADTGSLPRVTRAVPGSDTDYTIRISGTRPADAGIYHCVKFRKTGTGPDEEFRSGAGTTVSVSGVGAQEFQLLQPPGTVLVSAGETLTLNCFQTGVAPVGPVKWFKGSGSGRQLVYADKGSFPRVTRAVPDSNTDYTIRISDTRPADAGIYHCVKFRKTGTGPDEEFRSGTGTTVSVSGVGAQEFQLLQPQGAVLVSAGETLTLTCSVTGITPVGPTKWFKGSGSGRQLVYADTGSFPRVTRAVSGSDTDYTIRISDTRPADAGIYHCVKFRKTGTGPDVELRSGNGTTVSVSWAGAQEFQLMQPQGAVSVSVGETLTLICSVTGVAPVGPTKWFKGSGSGRQLVYADTGSFPRVTRAVPDSNTDYTIRISDTRPADAGIYHCVKFRKTGTGPDEEFRSGAGRTVSVSGVGAQEFQLMQPQGTVSVSVGETLTLICSVTGVAPVGSTKWFKGSGSGRQLVYADTGSFPRVTRAVPDSNTDYTIRISDTRPTDAGIYHCVKFRRTGTGPDVEFRSGAGTTVSVSAPLSGSVLPGEGADGRLPPLPLPEK